MVYDRRFVPLDSTNACRRSTLCSSETVSRRDLVGASVRRSMERFTKIVPVISHLLAKITMMVEVWSVPASVATVLARTGWTERTRLAYGSGGRNVREGKKRGDCVGKTKCGKGT